MGAEALQDIVCFMQGRYTHIFAVCKHVDEWVLKLQCVLNQVTMIA